jgi:predicted metal-dependent phosphoesterase TrpH
LLHAYPAIIHCHSSYSDGGKSIPEIARIADESGLRFLMMTDHNHLRPLKDGHNKWYGNVCLDIGYEINDENDQNHYLAFGLTEEVNRFQRPAQYVRDVAANGGFGFIAHPMKNVTSCQNTRFTHGRIGMLRILPELKYGIICHHGWKA